MDNFAAIFLLLFIGLIFIIVFAIVILEIWLLIASIVDVTRKNEADFPNKTIWLIGLILSFIIPFGFLIVLVYYFMYRPKLAFWN